MQTLTQTLPLGICKEADIIRDEFNNNKIDEDTCRNNCVTSLNNCGISRDYCFTDICKKNVKPSSRAITSCKTKKCNDYSAHECCTNQCKNGNMFDISCYLECINDVCKGDIMSGSTKFIPITTTSIITTSQNTDTVLPVQVPLSKKNEDDDDELSTISIVLIVIACIVILGLLIYAIRNKQLIKKFFEKNDYQLRSYPDLFESGSDPLGSENIVAGGNIFRKFRGRRRKYTP